VNDLSNLTLLSFHAKDSDYGNCLDISSEGFLSAAGCEELPDIAVGDGYSSPIRHFLARIDKKQVPSLIAVLQQALDA
jgi:hypothetical protein